MKIEQLTSTRIVAEEGKVFRNKETGTVYGKTVDLGYDYYKAGIPLEQGELQKPDDFEEILAPDETAEFTVDQVKRLRIFDKISKEIRENINSYGLTADEAKEFKAYFPVWGKDFHEGDTLKAGYRFVFNDKLYEVLQEHIIQAYYEPSLYTSTLYTELQ